MQIGSRVKRLEREAVLMLTVVKKLVVWRWTGALMVGEKGVKVVS